MGKHGPCCHCGVTSTPLWRNGPPEKPVLCNACGSRWRTKGTLANYAPMHARSEPDEFQDYKISQAKTISGRNKKAKGLKRTYHNSAHATEFGHVPSDFNQGFPRFGEDTSNRSSSGSAVSNSESCAQYCLADASDLTGASQPIAWDSIVPSRKRTCVTRPKPSPFEKLTEDLYTIWHEQQSSCLSACSEDDVLLESDKPMVSVEIGHGSVLIRHPNSVAREEESEASSLSIENKQQPPDPHLEVLPSLIEDPSARLDEMKKAANLGVEQYRPSSTRDKDQLENLQLMAYHNSPLCYIDLQDILNVNTLTSHFTHEEQRRLLKLLPSGDAVEAPDRNSTFMSSLRGMFNSPQFKENLLSFQNLLADGLFDNTMFKSEDCQVLKRYVLCNPTKSKWVEQYRILKDLKGESIINQSEAAGESNALGADSLMGVERPHDLLYHTFSGANSARKSPKRILTMSSYQNECMDKNCSFPSLQGLYQSVHNDALQVLGSTHFANEGSEQDLLLDVPSNASFPQAELLLPISYSFGAQASTTDSTVCPKFVNPG